MTAHLFDESYYEGLWGTVHRHDYCASLADWLIGQYGVGRYLDVGTGCGELVRQLRLRGCDAWGLEISEHALKESCAPEFVRRGSVVDIPFGSGFDVVHSNGLWNYVAEEDIERAWAECRRVGRLQQHNWDCSDYTDNWPEMRCVTYQSEQWWKDRFWPRVLVACPNHECKEYAFDAWISRVGELTYPNYDVLVVDNSPTDAFARRWEHRVPIVHLDVEGNDAARINVSMEVIRRRFLDGPYRWWFNLEADVIPPVDMIEFMVEHGKDADWIAHSYPVRGHEHLAQGIGCSMLSRRVMETFSFADASDWSPDGWLWGRVHPDGRFRTVELWSFRDVAHLGTGVGAA